MRTGARVAEILRRCVRGDAWRVPDPSLIALADGAEHPRRLGGLGGLDGLEEAALFHGIAGYAHHALRAAERVDRAVLDRLQQAYMSALATHMVALNDLAAVGRILDGVTPWLVFKGPVLASVHPRVDLRGYSDLDVAVPAAGFRPAVEAFERAGATLHVPSWTQLRADRAAELSLTLPGGGLIDLHWHLVNDPKERDDHRVPMAGLFERSRPVQIERATVTTLDPEDTLLTVALHACYSGGHRLVWLKDVDRLLACWPPDWQTVVGRAHEWGVGASLAGVLVKARRAIGTDVPPELVAELSGSQVWTSLVAWSDRTAPLERRQGGGSIARLVLRASRPTLGASLRRLLRNAGLWAAHQLRRGPRAAVDKGDTGVARAGFFDQVTPQQ